MRKNTGPRGGIRLGDEVLPQTSLLLIFHLPSLEPGQLEARAERQGRAGQSRQWLWLQSQHSAPRKEQAAQQVNIPNGNSTTRDIPCLLKHYRVTQPRKSVEGLERKEEGQSPVQGPASVLPASSDSLND